MIATRHTATRRPGLTLTEALVAMFVAAIGLIALMTLFPLGALQMAQAIKDERCEQTALQADGLLRAYWRTAVAERMQPQPDSIPSPPGFPGGTGNSATGGLPYAPGPDSFVIAFRSPNMTSLRVTGTPVSSDSNPTVFNIDDPQFSTGGGNPAYLQLYSNLAARFTTGVPPYPFATPVQGEPSYPVVLDPLGLQARGVKPESLGWVGGRNVPGFGPNTHPIPIPRRTIQSLMVTAPNAFNGNGRAVVTPGGPWQTNLTAASLFSVGLLDRSLRFSTLLDDLTYDESGTGAPPTDLTPQAAAPPVGSPLVSNLNKVERQGRYNWLAVLQQPSFGMDKTNLTIAVFDGRAPGYAPDGYELIYPRDNNIVGNNPNATTLPNLVVFVPNDTRVRVYYSGDRPPISKGKWVLDGTIVGFPVTGASTTYDPDNLGANWQAQLGTLRHLRHANFYRVVSATDGVDLARDPSGQLHYLDIDLEKPVQRSDGQTEFYAGSLYVLPGLAEVFDRPPLTK